MKLKQELSTAKRRIKQEEMNLTDAIKYLKKIKQINIVNAGELGIELKPKNFKDSGWDAEIKRLTNEYREQIRANIEAAQKQGIENQEEKDDGDDGDDDIEPPPGGWDTEGELTDYQKEVSSKWGGKRKTRRKRKTKKRRKKKTKKRRKKRRGKKKTKRRR